MKVEGKPQHTIRMRINVGRFDEGLGGAAPFEFEQIGRFSITTYGEMIINHYAYTPGFNPDEFNANILHEMGHILGMHDYPQGILERSAKYKGNIFKLENSVAVAKYNEIYGTNYDFLPMDDEEGSHLYDYVNQGDVKRVLDDGTVIPPLTKEFMANGRVFGAVSLAVYDDIGFEVDYSKAENYTP